MALPMVRTRASEGARRTNDRAVKGTGEDFTTTRTNKEGDKMKQMKLTDSDRKDMQRIASLMLTMYSFDLLSEGRQYWDEVHTRLIDKIKHGTNDGKPWVEPELTDEDAKKRPLVMARTGKAFCWQGPFVLIRARENGTKYIVEHDSGSVSIYRYARIATPEEIEAANADR
jgi:hypothetical protein